MSEGVSSSLAAVAHLRAALEEMAGALAQADLERLLACEARIENALTNVRNAALTSVSQPADIDGREQVEAARASLDRCRGLGLSLDSFIAARLSAHQGDSLYGPDAGPVSAALHALNLTV